MVGYSPDTIEYGDNNIIVSYDRYDKKIKEFELEKDFLEKLLIVKKHLAVDIKEYYDPIYDYLQKQDNVDEDLLKKAQAIYKFLDDLKK